MTQPDSSKATASSTPDAPARIKRINPRSHHWLPEQIALLGTMSDKLVSIKIGVSNNVVFYKRTSLGIAASPIKKQGHSGHKWTPEQIALLGSMSDKEAAIKIGVSDNVVLYKRKQLGIPPFVLTHQRNINKSAPHDWTPEQIALLGIKTDLEVAGIFGISKTQVRHKRTKLGIAPLHTRTKVKWTEGMIAALGTMSDLKLSELLGIKKDSVGYMRQKLGIPVTRQWRDDKSRVIPQVRAICQKHGGLLLDSEQEYKNCNSKLLIRCAKGHVFRKTAHSLYSGVWCYTCARMKRRRYSLVDLQRFAEERGGHCLNTQYTGANHARMDWECAQGHRWSDKWQKIKRLQNWCPECRAIEAKKRKADKKRTIATKYKKANQTGLPKTK